MKLHGWTQYLNRGAYMGVVSGSEFRSCRGKPHTRPAEGSEEARQSAMAAEMERDGLSREAAQKLASGQVTLKEPDWDTYEVQTLQRQADCRVYRQAFSGQGICLGYMALRPKEEHGCGHWQGSA